MNRRVSVVFVAICLAVVSLSATAAGQPRDERDASPQAEPQNAFADLFVARLAERRGDFDEAAARYARLASQAPADPERVNAAVSASLAALEPAAALRIARAGNAQNAAQDIAPQLVLAAEALRQRRWNTTTQNAGTALNSPGEAGPRLAANLLQAWALAGAGDVEAGLETLDRMPRPSGFAPSLLYQRAMMLEGARRIDEATAAYQSASNSAQPLPDEIFRLRNFIMRTQGAAAAEQVLPVASLGSVFQASPSGANLAPAPTPARSAALGMQALSKMAAAQGDPAQALRLLSLALILDPASDAARMVAADVNESLGQPDAAAHIFAQIPHSSPYYVPAQMRVVHLLQSSPDPQRAIEAALQLAANHPGPETHYVLAAVLLSNERYPEAIDAFLAVLATNQQDWRSLFGLASAHLAAGDWPAAETGFQQAVALAPQNPELLNAYGYALIVRRERVQEGMDLVRRALVARANDGNIMDSLGWGYFQLGQYPQAVAQLELAIRREPANGEIVDHLGDAYWRVGRHTEARYQWQRAAQITEDAAQRAAIEAKVTAGLPPTGAAAQ
jgi:tetratricopeptide (TPR) repeat protein